MHRSPSADRRPTPGRYLPRATSSTPRFAPAAWRRSTISGWITSKARPGDGSIQVGRDSILESFARAFSHSTFVSGQRSPSASMSGSRGTGSARSSRRAAGSGGTGMPGKQPRGKAPTRSSCGGRHTAGGFAQSSTSRPRACRGRDGASAVAPGPGRASRPLCWRAVALQMNRGDRPLDRRGLPSAAW